jgi:membrane glycosyltransferase
MMSKIFWKSFWNFMKVGTLTLLAIAVGVGVMWLGVTALTWVASIVGEFVACCLLILIGMILGGITYAAMEVRWQKRWNKEMKELYD